MNTPPASSATSASEQPPAPQPRAINFATEATSVGAVTAPLPSFSNFGATIAPHPFFSSFGAATAPNPFASATFAPEQPPAPQPRAFNFATEWLDEDGRVCPKNVDYATQCPKGHDLVSVSLGGGGGAEAQQPSDADVICRVCHGSTQRRHTCGWLTCSVAGCCGGYAVCAACVTVLSRALQPAAASTDNFCMTVTLLRSAAILRHHICSSALSVRMPEF
jgi:hypothetical protein